MPTSEKLYDHAQHDRSGRGREISGFFPPGWSVRLYRAFVSFCLVLACYWVYTLVVVPLIEVPGLEIRGQGLSPQEVAQAEERFQRYRRRLLPLFPEGTWQLGKTKIIETEDVIVLLEEHARIDEFHLRVWPCAGVLGPAVDEETQAIRSALVVEAPQGALLEFDAPVDLRLGQIRQPRRVILHGPVRLRQYSREGPSEQLLVVETEDVEVDAEKITTDGEVRFRLGPHFGKGRGLAIMLRPRGDGGGPSSDHQPPRTVDEIRVGSVDRLHVALPASSRWGGEGTDSQATEVVFELACDGPFRFDPVKLRATFEGNVRGWRSGLGAQDELRCQELILWLGEGESLGQKAEGEDRTADQSSTAKGAQGSPSDSGKRPAGGPNGFFAEKSGELDRTGRPGLPSWGNFRGWEVRRVQMRGGPAVVRAPSWQFSFEGNFLDYELATGEYFLGAEERTTVRYGGVRIVAAKLRGRLPFTALGTGWAQVEAELTGPGSLSHTFTGRSEPQISAQWQGQLFIRPQEAHQVVSLVGGAAIVAPALGKLQAQEVHIWLLPPTGEEDPSRLPLADPLQSLPVPKPSTPRESAAPETLVQIGGLRPERLLALKNVVLESSQAQAAADELRVVFDLGPDRPRLSGMMPESPPHPALANQAVYTVWQGGLLSQAAADRSGKAFVAACALERTARNPASLPVLSLSADRSGEPADFRPLLSPAQGELLRVAIPSGQPGLCLTAWRLEAEGPPDPGTVRGLPLERSIVPAFQISAGAIHLRLRAGSSGLECAEAFLERSVQLVEKRTSVSDDPRDQPALLTGQRVYVADPGTPYWSVLVEGDPGHAEARGLGLTAPRIALNAASNRLWVDQAGRLQVWLNSQETGWTSASGHVRLDVEWGGSLVFDGQVARFDGSVQAHAQEARLTTQELEVHLAEPLTFSRWEGTVRPRPDRLVCSGPTVLANLGAQGGSEGSPNASPRDFLEVTGLNLEWATGEFIAKGPGRVVVFPTRQGDLEASFGQLEAGAQESRVISEKFSQAGQSPEAPPGPSPLLVVRFADRLDGNLWQRRARMVAHVRGLYVQHWPWGWIPDPDDPADPPAGGVRFRCGTITAVQLGPPGANRSWEIVAEENVRLEGQEFVARAPRACFVQGKELLVLEGAPRTPAELYRQERPGQPPAGHSATRILYWLGSKRLVVEGLQTLQVP